MSLAVRAAHIRMHADTPARSVASLQEPYAGERGGKKRVPFSVSAALLHFFPPLAAPLLHAALRL